ncbi:hypothetical protein IV203_036247 [Nitzschia inconspicua]|uniref:Uncharacterized protein n=1 Tax=Nitzschia inconspicua TaxID=303405 RepID=A0A9K3LFH3_9STRA|nr:hypothetical protein IV203_036247 [Nitzschia inconspicua]
MKIVAVPLIALVAANGLSIAGGFSATSGRGNNNNILVIQASQSNNVALRVSATVEDETKSDFASAMPAEVDPHDIIGVEPEKLALGINPDEFLEWVGTKEQLMKKFQADNKNFSPERVQEEVERFMMDAESVNMYIKYLKDRKENPQKYANEALEAELSLSNPKTAALYAAWLIAGLSFGYIKNEIIEPKFASGEWKNLEINIPFFSSKTEATVEAVSSVSQAVDTILQQSTDLVS